MATSCFGEAVSAHSSITMHLMLRFINYVILSYEVKSESEITPCNKIDKPLVVY